MTDKQVYFDADVLLSYVNDDADRVPTIEALLDEGRKAVPEIEIFTSEISIVEVAFGAAEQQRRALDDETEGRINSLWMPGSPVRMVEYYRLIGDDAKSLIRLAITKGWSLKPMDAIHFATARRMKVAEFYTYDGRLAKFDNDVGFKVCEPYTRQKRLM